MRYWLVWWLQSISALVALVAGMWLLIAHLLGLQLLAVQTGSMCPSFCPGDALIMQKVAVTEVKPGAVVSYRSSRSPNELITHRLVADYAGILQTKGDALIGLDPPIRASLLAGRVVTVLPGLGRALDDLRSLPGLIICIYLPALGLVYSELKRFEVSWNAGRPYRLIR
jgi:signal peptidase I